MNGGERRADQQRTQREKNGRGRPRAPAHVEIEMTAYISRAEAARSMNYTPEGIRKHEAGWFADAMIKRNGVVYYHRRRFEEFQSAMQGGDAARCMELFAKGLSPTQVVAEVRPRRPWIVRQCFAEHLALVELDPHAVVVRFPPTVNAKAWKSAHGLPPDEPIHPEFVRRAIELACLIPELRERCMLAVRQASRLAEVPSAWAEEGVTE